MPNKSNPFNEYSIEGSEKTIKVFQLKCPWPVNIAILLNDGTKFIRTMNHSYAAKDEIIKQAKNDGFKIEVSPLMFPAPGLCPKCKRKGTPSIGLKNNDYSYYTEKENISQYEESRRERKPVKQNPTYWLRYRHKESPTICLIQQYQGTNQGTFKPKKNNSNVNPELLLIGRAIDTIKKEYFESVFDMKVSK